MNFITLVLYIAIAGFVVYLIGLIPMPQIFRQIIYALSILALVIFVLQFLGVAHIPFIEKVK